MTHEEVHWGYFGSIGPENWARLCHEYRLCGEGTEQSPVNITGNTQVHADPIVFSYGGAATAARNNGHTVYLDYGPGDSIEIGGQSYELQGIHYHSPAEHLLDGESFAAELHLVHQDASGNLAVVGLLFRAGEPSPIIQGLIDAAPDAGASVELHDGPASSGYVPDILDYYGYSGSLTTPPCTEGVRWIVMQSVGTVSREQASRLQEMVGGPNNRPVQPIGGRQIFAVAR